METYKGSCHCGNVQFEASIDFSKGTGRCNCTFCLKNRFWGAHIPPTDFKLLTGLNSLQSYSKTRRQQLFDMNRRLEVYENDLCFCNICGNHAFGIGNIPEIGGAYVSVNVACLNDVDFSSVMENPIHYFNGKDEDWFNIPTYTKHL
ncbi:MAG: GFA family protein [Pseudobdellovibrio sp.]